jgi:hypothetical protein
MSFKPARGVSVFRIAVTALVLFAACLTLACQQTLEEPPVLEKNEISGERLWRRITEETDYKRYSFWPGHEGVQPGQSPHGRFHRVYINKILKDALPISTGVAPPGSVIVKENLTSDRVATAVTVMAKVAGYDPENNDWFWVYYSIDGRIENEGAIEFCIECHRGMRENDYVIIRRLDSSLPQ